MLFAALVLCVFVKVVASDPIAVTLENYATVEFDQQAERILKFVGDKTNVFFSYREPTPVDQQTVVRMNRDTLYMMGVFDVSQGLTITVPETNDRYLSVMAVNRKGFTPLVFVGPGTYRMDEETAGTKFVILIVRILVDANDSVDVAAVNALQDNIKVRAGSARAFPTVNYDPVGYKTIYSALTSLGPYIEDTTDTFGREGEVNPLKFLIATTIGWGGLPQTQAMYDNISPNLPLGEYKIEVPAEVPVDGFWSVTVYNKQGFFGESEFGSSNVNSLVADVNPDNTITIHLGGCQDGRVNCLAIMEGWNYIVRMYQPRNELLNKEWSFPAIEPVTVSTVTHTSSGSGSQPGHGPRVTFCDSTANQLCKGGYPCREPFVKCLTPSKCQCLPNPF